MANSPFFTIRMDSFLLEELDKSGIDKRAMVEWSAKIFLNSKKSNGLDILESQKEALEAELKSKIDTLNAEYASRLKVLSVKIEQLRKEEENFKIVKNDPKLLDCLRYWSKRKDVDMDFVVESLERKGIKITKVQFLSMLDDYRAKQQTVIIPSESMGSKELQIV